ncbi:hypothetical protein [Haladaptatus sp. R4]|nr:hypothetical protein [Haladaptatus sp. R4]
MSERCFIDVRTPLVYVPFRYLVFPTLPSVAVTPVSMAKVD